MHGNHDRVLGPPATLFAIHGAVVALVAWLLFRGVPAFLDGRIPFDPSSGALSRRIVLLGCALIYLARFAVTGLVLLPRKMDWHEVAAVGPFLAVVHLALALLGGTNAEPIGSFVFVGGTLYLFGSYLNTASEWGRQRWKSHPEHSEKLYTAGFYRWCMHPNYLGDVLLFTGYALVTGRAWALLVPLVMALSFAFVHIPALDSYLALRYGEAFERYAARTRRLFPGFW